MKILGREYWFQPEEDKIYLAESEVIHMHTILELVENYALALDHEIKALEEQKITTDQFQMAVDEIAGKLHQLVQDASK